VPLLAMDPRHRSPRSCVSPDKFRRANSASAVPANRVPMAHRETMVQVERTETQARTVVPEVQAKMPKKRASSSRFQNNAHAKLIPDQRDHWARRDRMDHLEKMADLVPTEFPAVKDPLAQLDHLALLVPREPMVPRDRTERLDPDQRAQLAQLERTARRAQPVHLAQPVNPERMDPLDPKQHLATVEPLATPAKMDPKDQRESLANPETPEAANTAHLLVCPLDIKSHHESTERRIPSQVTLRIRCLLGREFNDPHDLCSSFAYCFFCLVFYFSKP